MWSTSFKAGLGSSPSLSNLSNIKSSSRLNALDDLRMVMSQPPRPHTASNNHGRKGEEEGPSPESGTYPAG